MKDHTIQGMDIYSQALKALAVRCPFGGEDASAAGGVSSSGGPLLKLPSSGDSKRKNRARKTQAASKKRNFGDLDAGLEGNPRMFWSQMEDYFREVTADDMQLLFPRTRLGLTDSTFPQDPCFEVRPLGRRYLDVWAEEDRKSKMARDLEAVAAMEQSARGVKRKLLTASPVSKRRKTVSTPASTDVITLVISPPEGEEDDLCHVCYGADSLEANPIVFCDSCNMATHQHCYGLRNVPGGQWLCSWCTAKLDSRLDPASYSCVLCTVRGGALKPVADEFDPTCKHKRFAHLACSQWIPETYIQDLEAMEPIKNVEGIREERWRLLCVVCKEKHGACIQCSHGVCAAAFHPLCARGAKFWMEVSSREDSQDVNVESRAYCQKHTAVRLDKPPGEQIPDEKPPTEVFEEGPPSADPAAGPARPGYVKGKSLPRRKAGLEDGKKFSDLDQVELKSYLREVVGKIGAPIEAIALETRLEQDSLLAWLQGEAQEGVKFVETISDWLQTYHSTTNGVENDLKHETPCAEARFDTSVPAENASRIEAVTDCDMVEDPDDTKSVDDDKTDVPAPLGTPFEVPRCTISKAEDWTKENSSSDELADDMHEDFAKAESADMLEASSGPEADPTETECESVNLQPYVVPEVLGRLRLLEQPGNSVRLSTSEAEAESHNCNDRPEDASALKEQWEQLRQAKQLGILDWFPQDELEGEIFILQSQLIDRAQANCHSSERLIAKVLSRLSSERQAAREIMQDLSVVSQFLADAKEAKKLGRKEKRDREAQAVLAAATAAAAASPRTGYVKRDASNQEEPYYEDHYKFNWPHSNGSPHSPTVRPLKPPIPRPPRLSISSSFRLSQTERRSNLQPEDHPTCDVCSRSDFTRSNRILHCGQCKVAVHQDCYGVPRLPTGPWYCQPCSEAQGQQPTSDTEAKPVVPRCALCPNSQGAFRKSIDGRWVHVFCALWIPETTVGKEQTAAIGGLEAIPIERFNLTCGICQQQQGACVKCNFGHCVGAFHPICARASGLYMSVKDVGGGRTNYRAYCEKHSLNQRAKSADSVEPKQYGTSDDMNTLKQIRVEFERVRLICERICKRERIKREFAHCIKDLYVTQLSVVALGGAAQPLSETVRSSSNANGVWHHHHPESDDAKLVNETCFERPAQEAGGVEKRRDVATSSKLGAMEGQVEVPIREGKEQKKSKRYGRQHSEPLGREKIMTPSEASMHNKLLPKGYAYVPVDMLEKGMVMKQEQPDKHH